MDIFQSPAPGSTPRTSIRRGPSRAVTDRSAAHAVLDEALVAHVAVAIAGQPYALPIAHARDGDRLLLHGSTGSRLFRALAAGAPACATVTVLDGLVLARSLFESSMNYRSVVVLGRCSALPHAEKREALIRLSDRLAPGRTSGARPPSPRELAATSVLALDLNECSVKARTGDPDDPDEDVDLPFWAGTVPIVRRWGVPVPAQNLRTAAPAPPVAGWPVRA